MTLARAIDSNGFASYPLAPALLSKFMRAVGGVVAWTNSSEAAAV